MKIQTLNDEILKRYLLDDVTDQERQAIEERFLEDDSFFEEMLALEDELYFDYRQDQLTDRERLVFEKKFLQSPEEREKSAFAEAFLQTTAELAVEKAHQTSPRPVETGQSSWWQSISAFFDFSGSWLQYGMAAAAVLLAFGLGIMFFQNAQLRREMAELESNRSLERQEQERLIEEKQKRQAALEEELAAERALVEQNEKRIREIEAESARLEQEIAEARRRVEQTPRSQPAQPAPAQPARSVIALALAPGLSRAGDEVGTRIKLSPGTRTLRLNLILKKTDDYQSYQVALSNVDEGHVWTAANLKVRGANNSRTVSVSVPARLLKRADYELVLSGLNAAGQPEEIDSYYFTVLR